MKKLVGKTFGDVTLHRKDRVLPLAAVNSSMKNMARDSADQHHATLQQDHICRELAPRPLSLFD